MRLKHEGKKVRALVRAKDYARAKRVDLRREVEYTMLKRVGKCS